jgi:long-chain fatty acid transport protein
MFAKIAVFVGLFVGVVSGTIYGINGANLIGLTPQSMGAGGTGIALNTGFETLSKNPALMSKNKDPQFFLGANFASLNPQSSISYSGPVATANTGFVTNEATFFVIPEMGFMAPVTDRITAGIGLFGTAGFGVDYRNETAENGIFSQIRTHFMSLQLIPGVSYAEGPWSLGVSTRITYGGLSLSAMLPDASGSPSTISQRGGGFSDTFSAGFQVGGSYDVTPTTVLGLSYTSSVPLTFKRIFDFDRNGTYDDFNFELPSELGVGVASRHGDFTFSTDVKQIFWSTTEGFGDMGWKDQTVLAMGIVYEWLPKKSSLRMGYNYSPSVVGDKHDLSVSNGFYSFGSGQYLDSNIAFFNLVGFGPALVEGQSLTIGADYRFSPFLKLDLAAEFILSDTVYHSGKTSLAGPDDTDAVYGAKNEGVIVAAALTWSL